MRRKPAREADFRRSVQVGGGFTVSGEDTTMTFRHLSESFRNPVRLAALSLACAALVATGCQQDEDDPYASGDGTRTPMAGEMPVDEALRTAMLRDAGIPADVRPVVSNDLRNVDLAGAEMHTTENGRVYRITYYQPDGRTAERWYNANGLRIEPPQPQEAATIDPVTAGDRQLDEAERSAPPSTRPTGGDLPPTTRPIGGDGTGPQ